MIGRLERVQMIHHRIIQCVLGKDEPVRKGDDYKGRGKDAPRDDYKGKGKDLCFF